MAVAAGTIETTKLSPPPKSRGLAIAALVMPLMLLLWVATLGVTAISAVETERATVMVGWVLSTVGVLAAAAITAVGFKSLSHSVKATQLSSRDQVLGARASASKSREDAFIAFALVFSMLVVLSLIFFITMNDGAIRKTFLKWDLIAKSGLDIVQAFGTNLWIAFVAELIVLVFGLILAVGRSIPGRPGKPIRALSIAYIDVMRAIPAIIVLYLVGFGLPTVDIPILSGLSPVSYAIIALALTYSAYTAEVYRSGIEAVHPSQWSATRSLGFSYVQTLRFVILPQAVRTILPPMLTMFVALQKDTALVNIIGAMDAFNQAKFYASAAFNLSSVTVVAALFVLVTIPQARFVDWMIARSESKRAG